jgi:hypothetical protein
MESIHRRDDREALAARAGDQLRQRRGQLRLSRGRRARDAEQEAPDCRIDDGEQVARQALYSVLEAAQRLIPLSVAYRSISSSSSGLNST